MSARPSLLRRLLRLLVDEHGLEAVLREVEELVDGAERASTRPARRAPRKSPAAAAELAESIRRPDPIAVEKAKRSLARSGMR